MAKRRPFPEDRTARRKRLVGPLEFARLDSLRNPAYVAHRRGLWAAPRRFLEVGP